MARITNRRRNNASTVLICDPHSPDAPPKLDIYVGYTEDIIKIFARIAGLYALEWDPEALSAEISSM